VDLIRLTHLESLAPVASIQLIPTCVAAGLVNAAMHFLFAQRRQPHFRQSAYLPQILTEHFCPILERN
jgi:hypothetical protein